MATNNPMCTQLSKSRVQNEDASKSNVSRREALQDKGHGDTIERL